MEVKIRVEIPTLFSSKKKWYGQLIVDKEVVSRTSALSAAGMMDGLIPALEKLKRDNDGSE